MHWAAHGHTAAEIIYQRADASQPNMGMTNWVCEKIRKQEAGIVKNYLNEQELNLLNRIVTMYLEFGEMQLTLTMEHLLEQAGNPNLMTKELINILCEHAAGNYRILCNMSGDLLDMAARLERTTLDEQLYFECFTQAKSSNKRKS